MHRRRRALTVALFVSAMIAIGCGDDEPSVTARVAAQAAEPPADAIDVTASPSAVRAGDEVSLTLAQPSTRAVAWWMIETGEPTYLLIAATADGYRPCDGCARWFMAGDGGWEQRAVRGAGPDVVQVPPVAESGEYRICPVSAFDEVGCATVSVLA